MDHVDVLRKVMKNVQLAHPFHIDAMVILPDHVHALWTLPVGDCDYPMRWMLIKAGFFAASANRRTARKEPNHQRRTRNLATA